MKTNLGIYHLFAENKKAKQLFYEWCKENKNLCAYDLENIANDLFIPCINTTNRYIHFSNANILDFLEDNGYYIGLPLRGKFKFVTCCYYRGGSKNVNRPFYNNSGIKDRTKALETGVIKCIEHLENSL